MAQPIVLTPKAARRLALRSQLLGARPFGRSKKSTLAIIEHLGYVQIDTISVIERAHHHILWTRQPGYVSANLDRLLSKAATALGYSPSSRPR